MHCVPILLIIDTGLEILFVSKTFHASEKSRVNITVCYIHVLRKKYLIVSFRTDLRSSYIMNSTIAGIEVSETF